jgi:hypothetical protein
MRRSSRNPHVSGTTHSSIKSITIATRHCYAWGIRLNNIMTLPTGKHRLVENHLLYIIFHRQVSKRTNPPSGNCDRTTSEMRGLSPKIILGDSRRSENAQTHTYKHTVPNMNFKLKLLQIKWHVLGFTKDKAQNASKDNQIFCGSICLPR